jgi:hypothetical protein
MTHDLDDDLQTSTRPVVKVTPKIAGNKNIPASTKKGSAKRIVAPTTAEASTKKFKKPLVEALKSFFVFPKYDYRKQTSIVLAADPGIKNFAYVLLEAQTDIDYTEAPTAETLLNFIKNIKIRNCGFLKSCLTELRQDNIIPYIHRFAADNAEVFNHSIDYLILERYQARDFRGPRNEVINFNICNTINCLLQSKHALRNTRLVIPAQWKKYYTLDKAHKIKGVDLVYETWKKDKQLRKNHNLTDHQTDAFLIGVYLLLDIYFKDYKDLPDYKNVIVPYIINNTANFFRTYFATYGGRCGE